MRQDHVSYRYWLLRLRPLLFHRLYDARDRWFKELGYGRASQTNEIILYVFFAGSWTHPSNLSCPARMFSLGSRSDARPNLMNWGSCMLLNVNFVVLSKDFLMFSVSSANFVLRSSSVKYSEHNATSIKVERITVHKNLSPLGHEH